MEDSSSIEIYRDMGLQKEGRHGMKKDIEWQQESKKIEIPLKFKIDYN